MNFRYPNITAGSPAEQIQQLKGFLYNLVEQLNLQEGGSSSPSLAGTSLAREGGKAGIVVPAATPMSTFNQVKDLIIKSADIINAYDAEINRRLEGKYVAESDFGTYKAETSQTIKENSVSIERAFSDLQEISGELEQIIATNAYVRQGLLFTVGEETLEAELGQTIPEGTGIYGVEVGQTTQVDGIEVFNKFARFTAYGMTLYDNNGNLSAYITDRRLYIPDAVIKNSLTRGGFMETILADGSSVERWVGV